MESGQGLVCPKFERFGLKWNGQWIIIRQARDYSVEVN